jgi:Xaa-Pro aminopeptidase
MVGKIDKSINERRSKATLADSTPEMMAAAGSGHHLVTGPGEALESTWVDAGLELPDLSAMRTYRVDRAVEHLHRFGFDGAILMDPMNIRYVTDSTNMQIWVMHNAARYAWVGSDGRVVLWDYMGCEFLSAHHDGLDDIRAATSSDYFIAGQRYDEKADQFAAEIAALARETAGAQPRVAVDRTNVATMLALQRSGLVIGNGQEVMEEARRIKSPDELRAMRCAVHACESTMAEMRESLEPGMTEREVWAMLHAGNIRRAGEWIETQILASGPRTNPWFQEVSSRVIENGDVVAYDTDLVGAYGMMVDISRTWVAGDAAARPAARHAFDLALEQIERNVLMLRPGVTYKELSLDAWFPPVDRYRHYSCLFHGVGQCDEVPDIYFPQYWESSGYDGVLEEGMVMTVEAFVGARSGGEGVKLENQVLITADGPELLTRFPLDL